MLYSFDKEVCKKTRTHIIAGVDEAGRGPLAGPVYAAAVILDVNGEQIEGVNDSKKLSEKKRERLYEEITCNALCYGVAWASVEEIEELNILNATFLAMRRAVDKLGIKPELVLVDGNADPKLLVDSQLVLKGDATSASIAAASILAKVARDRYIVELSENHPQYRFDKHKGYGTKFHYEMLDKYGPSPIHRPSFLKKWEAKKG